MYVIYMIIDGETYRYGADSDRNKANEVAMMVRDERGIDVYVEYDPD